MFDVTTADVSIEIMTHPMVDPIKDSAIQIESLDLTLDSCASGLKRTFTVYERAQFLALSQDRNCLLKLSSFLDKAGERYLPQPGREFTTWRPGDRGLFTNSLRQKSLLFRVKSQLSEVLQETDTVAYEYAQIKEGPESAGILAKKWDQIPIDTPFPQSLAPRLLLRQANLTSIDYPSQTLFYSFYFECERPMRNQNCGGVSASDLEISVAPDRDNDCGANRPQLCDRGPFRRGFVFHAKDEKFQRHDGFAITGLPIPWRGTLGRFLVLSVRRPLPRRFWLNRIWNFDDKDAP